MSSQHSLAQLTVLYKFYKTISQLILALFLESISRKHKEGSTILDLISLQIPKSSLQTQQKPFSSNISWIMSPSFLPPTHLSMIDMLTYFSVGNKKHPLYVPLSEDET